MVSFGKQPAQPLLYSSPLVVRDGMGNLHQTSFVIFCYIALVQWTLSEVLVNQATGHGKWWGHLLKHQHSPCWGMYPFPIWFGLIKGAHNENPKIWLYVCTSHRCCPLFRNYHGFWPQLKKTLGFVLPSRKCSNRSNAIHIASIWWECCEIETK